jgi:predicted alpha/beta-fold hydrolase
LPVIRKSEFRPARLLRNPHLQTVWPSFGRRVAPLDYRRERLDTPDGDFLDLDWSRVGSRRLVVACHGLEGDSRRDYMRGMLGAFNRRGWDGVAINLRGCSGEMNRALGFYHSGMTADLDLVVETIARRRGYDSIALVGFSLGGNLVLKYLGEQGAGVTGLVRAAAAVSVPCDLASSSLCLAAPANRLYLWRFLRSLKRKVRLKADRLGGLVDLEGVEASRDFREFDDRCTAPLHGFRDAEEYWRRSSSVQFLGAVAVPTLLLSAADDPFLSAECYPWERARENPNLHLEVPASGGHLGFVADPWATEYWHETRVAGFVAAAPGA